MMALSVYMPGASTAPTQAPCARTHSAIRDRYCADPAQSPFIPVDAKIVVGAVAPASPDPIPIVLLPGYEYRMREWRHPDTHEMHWRLERRKSAQLAENDE